MNTLQTIYKALPSSYLSYGIVAWGQAAKTHANQLFFLHKCALRLMHFGHYTVHTIPYFFSSNILPALKMLYFKSVVILMHDSHKKFSSTECFTFIQHLLIKYTLITLDPRQEVITKLKFKDGINKANHFQNWGPKYGIAYLRVLEISPNQSFLKLLFTKRKYT